MNRKKEPTAREARDVATLSADLASIVRGAQDDGTTAIVVISSLLSGLAYEAVEANVPAAMLHSLLDHAYQVAESRKVVAS